MMEEELELLFVRIPRLFWVLLLFVVCLFCYCVFQASVSLGLQGY